MMRPLRWILLLALGATSCRTPASTPQATQPPGAPSPDAASPGQPPPAAEPTHPLELVPARARMMLMARSPQRLAEVLERDRLAAELPGPYHRMVDDLQRTFGRDLLDPAELAAVGVDPSAPMGLAVVDLHDEVVVFFGGSPDPAPLVAALEQVTGKPAPERTVGTARLLQLESDLTLVLRQGMFAFVLVDRHRDGQPDYPLEVARIDPGRSLAHSTTLERSYAGLPADADVQGLLDVSGLLRDELERSLRFEQDAVADANRRLAEARQRGAPPEELDALQQQIHTQELFVSRRRRERQIGELLLSRTLGSVEGIGLAVDADARGLTGRIHVALGPDSAFRELLVAGPPPAALLAVGDAPQIVVAGQLSVATAVDLLAQALLADGSSYAEFNDELRDELGLDFDRTLRPQLTGEATFVLTAAERLEPTGLRALEQALGGMLAFGVADEAAVHTAIAALPAQLPALHWAEAPEVHGWSVELPEARRLWIGVGAGQLAMSTDRAAIARLQAGQAGAASTHWPSPESWQRLTEGPAAARLAMHHRMPVMLVLTMLSQFESFDFPRDVDSHLQSDFPDDDIRAVPRSKKVLRLEQKLAKAVEARRVLARRRDQERMVIAWNLTAGLGVTAGAVRPTPTGLMIEGGHYVDGGMGRYLRAVVELTAREGIETSLDGELARAQKERDQAEERLIDARRGELERALQRQRRPFEPPPPPPDPHF
ncbi:MAG: hypothetical protein KDK70_18125 [Myxococcales bacterium]|nr:hypothetical protein [Myxococcales bacterium]